MASAIATAATATTPLRSENAARDVPCNTSATTAAQNRR